MKRIAARLAKSALKKPEIKEKLDSLKRHFKEYSYPLNYLHYYEDFNLDSISFNGLMLRAGFKIKYDLKRVMVVIYKPRKRK